MHQLFEQFLSTATMINAENELIGMRSKAVPILQMLLTGEAKNAHGIPYRALGLPLRCALETALRLGAHAKPLEPLLVVELKNGHPVAARALGALGSLQPESVIELANSIGGDPELAFEAAAALVHCSEDENELVRMLVSKSERAKAILAKVRGTLPRR
jgi:hypothetical protein